MSGHSDVAVAERNPELLIVDVERFRRGVTAGEQRALAQEDLARAAIDDATYRGRIAGLASERDFANYVIEIASEIRNRNWPEKFRKGILSTIL